MSRVSLNINYGSHLTNEAREQIWRNLTKDIKVEGIDYRHLANFNLNGRRIKNCLKLLVTLSQYKAVTPTMQHLLDIIKLSQNDTESVGYSAKSGI